MSLDYELQKYPKEITLKDGSTWQLRPLRKEDEKAFHEFFLAVPDSERMFIKHRVTEPPVIREWCQNIDLGRNMPLLALTGGQIAGVATLHQQLGGWKRHIGRSTAVLEAAIKVAARDKLPMLFAATLNQVDIGGGYTGWTPASFVVEMHRPGT